MPSKEEQDEEYQLLCKEMENFYFTPHNRKERRHYIGYKGAEYKNVLRYHYILPK